MSASKAKRAQVAERRSKAIAMVLAGVDYDTIADRLGYASRGAAHTDVDRALSANLTNLETEAGKLREIQFGRYQRLLAAVWPKALKGDLKAVEGAARLVDRIVRLWGLAEPERLDVNVDAQRLGDEILALLREQTSDGETDGDEGDEDAADLP
ncbi:hypothetical protein ABTY98_05435 [Streptomyces sp. NPDC096040]|uniref:hypothetical protein n=1 Tax=Streptomyces sp. NPDC096040 TaxID=3155541 RepID=UPI003317BC6E